MLWARYWTSRKSSRTRWYWLISTPVPIWPFGGYVKPGVAAIGAFWRVCPTVLAFVMLCPVVSRAAWWAWMPRSAVSSPRKVEIPIVLGLRVEDGEGLRRARPAARPVTGLGRARHEAHQVVEERELLADQHAVLVMHTADLEQQAAQLEAGGADRLDLG